MFAAWKIILASLITSGRDMGKDLGRILLFL
jgi:hypothetical protein